MMLPKHVRALVGRAQELAQLDELLDQVAGGVPWFLQIVGEAGIGKSRLLAELARRGEGRGCLVLDGRAAEFEQDLPFGLIVAALNDYLGSLDPVVMDGLDQDELRELAAIFPSLRQPKGPAAPTGDGAERYRLHYSIRGVLERLAKRQPLILSLDDVHWADAASVEVISHLLRRFRGPLLTAVAYRHAPARFEAKLEGGARVDLSSRIDLAPLTPEEARELIGPEVDDATRTILYRESGGNPFYIEQLARSSHVSQDRMPRVSARSAESVPRAVIAAIREQLLAVSDEARRALEAAAVAGESFEPELVGAIAELDARAALAALDELLEVDLIRTTDAPRRFRFRHPIVRRAVYDHMPQGWQVGHTRGRRGRWPALSLPPARSRTMSRPRRRLAMSRRSPCSRRRGVRWRRAHRRPRGDGCLRRPDCCPSAAGMSGVNRCCSRPRARSRSPALTTRLSPHWRRPVHYCRRRVWVSVPGWLRRLHLPPG